MKRIVILGCENSHADNFLSLITKKPAFSEIEVIGVYSEDSEAANKLHDKYGVPVMSDYAEAVGKVDGIMITARHGDNHHKYAKPYIQCGIPMFIDKPFTVSEADAVEFAQTLKANNVPICGGSTLRHNHAVQQLKLAEKLQAGGQTLGGVVRAPIVMNSPHAGFFFYSQHLVDILTEIFGRYPQAVHALPDDSQNKTVQFFYEHFSVTGIYMESSFRYFAARFAQGDSQGTVIPHFLTAEDSTIELNEYLSLLNGQAQPMSYSDMIAPVFIQNAIQRSLESGKRETISYQEV